MSRARAGRFATNAEARISVVVSTHERPWALDSVLYALWEQSDSDFDIAVADDGSGQETAAVVVGWLRRFGSRLEHVWQPDEGFRLALARNRGALAARGDYLVFIDGDVVPRTRFVQALRAAARPGWFVAGRRLELSRSLTGRALAKGSPIHRHSFVRWLWSTRDISSFGALTSRDRRVVGNRGVPEFEPHGRAYGFLLGVARADFERVDGFDSRYVGWGEEDVDLAVRLRRLGLRCGHAGPEATVVHLWHPRRHRRDGSNHALLEETWGDGRIEARSGLSELARTASLATA